MDMQWRVGAFAEQFPDEARTLGRVYAMECAANSMLYDAAGQVRPGAIQDACCGGMMVASSGSAMGCCADSPCDDEADSSCSRGTCDCDEAKGGDGFEAIYPEADAAIDESRALAAAIRDILADDQVADVPAAMDQARVLYAEGHLSDLYTPSVPAKKLPDGADAPAKCPICGCCACPTCGCSCCCCDGKIEMNQDGADMAAGM